MGSPVIAHGSPPTMTMSSPSKSSYLGSPQQLTPRSKIKAMLAAVDDESENEAYVEASTKKDDDDHTHLVDTNATSLESSTQEPGDGDAGESDEGPVVPRGRLAARLQSNKPANGTRISSDEGTEEEDGGNVYERIKKQLLPKINNKRASPEATEQPSLGSRDGIPVASGRRQRLQPRKASRTSSSPIATPLRGSKSPPRLFLTPSAPSLPAHHEESDSDKPDSHANQRFLALVARKRAEREAKQAAEAEKKAAREERLRENSTFALGVSEDESENNAGARKLTQQARPTRKASKKALEEMNRETQRMNRNMQLAHQAKTKKKITKESLFARFNFRTSSVSTAENQQTVSSSTVASSVNASDAENGPSQQTPPTSPVVPSDSAKKPIVEDQATDLIDTSAMPEQPLGPESELPDIQEMIDNPRPVLEKGKGKAVDLDHAGTRASAIDRNTGFDRPQNKILFTRPTSRSKQQDIESDSDLEILPRQRPKSRLDTFNRLPTKKAREARSLQTLQALAHLHSPGKQTGRARATMTSSEMQRSLRQRARQQAAAERAEKIQELKNKGVIIQTAEERQKDQAEVEDLVEKARKEAEEIKRKEKDAVRKEKRANGGLATLAESSDEDEDYQEDEEIASGVELSGSDEEDAVNEDNVSGSEDGESTAEAEGIGGVDAGDKTVKPSRLIEDEASEDAGDEDSANCSEIADDERAEDEEIGVPLPRRKARANRVIDDDEDGDEPLHAPAITQESPTQITPGKPIIPGLGINGRPTLPLMGMTQAFAATMADTQISALDHLNVDQEQDSLRFLSPVPEPDFPVLDPNDTESMVVDSQAGADSILQDSAANADISLHFSQSQIQYDTVQDNPKSPAATQDEDIPDPTQDVGFGMSSPAANRFVLPPPSTVDTVLLPGRDSPVKKKKGRLQRGKDTATNVSSDDGYNRSKEPADFEISANAFEVMKKKRIAAAATKPYDKSKSEAKEMVEEEAFESEDEYAGLGGASDDGSGGSEDEETRKMIEHGDVEVDERKLAAFYADKERIQDEANINKLYRDLQTGGLRRNRGTGADFNLSDSEDDAEARHRARRLQEAKKRKALLEDERIGKIAEDPKKMAFLRAIEDRGDEEAIDFLDQPEGGDKGEGSTQEVIDSQLQPVGPEAAGTKRKRPLEESLPDTANRVPPAARRTKGKRPSTLAEIRESVSFLIETPESASFMTNITSSASNSEDENGFPNDAGKEISLGDDTQSMPPPPSTRRRTNNAPFTDRLALLRASTSASSLSARLAFAPDSTSSTFKVPTLLRRATTSALNSNPNNNTDSHGISTLAATEQAAGAGNSGKAGFGVKNAGSRKGGSILGQAREAERRMAVEGVERRRKEERERVAKARRRGLVVRADSWDG